MDLLKQLHKKAVSCFPKPLDLAIGFLDDETWLFVPVAIDLLDVPTVLEVCRLNPQCSDPSIRCILDLDGHIVFDAPISVKCVLFLVSKLRIAIPLDPEISLVLSSRAAGNLTETKIQ